MKSGFYTRTHIALFYLLSFIGLISVPILLQANLAPKNTNPQGTYLVCFSPQQRCAQNVIRLINQAKHSIQFQAYSFTYKPIVCALINAMKRHIRVQVILDKTQLRKHSYSVLSLLYKYKIPTWIDYRPAIAHNKVCIIDQAIIETGSFNYTASAENRNAENMLIIYSQKLAKLYENNWQLRVTQSKQIVFKHTMLKQVVSKQVLSKQNRAKKFIFKNNSKEIANN